MCGRPETEAERNASDREKLQRAIERLERHHFCEDAMTALAAARKYLATLPICAPRKVKVTRYLVVASGNDYGPYADQYDAHRVACARGGRIVELSGEYETT